MNRRKNKINTHRNNDGGIQREEEYLLTNFHFAPLLLFSAMVPIF
jgi:hypothetical protein